jgi:hypothetical protein
MNNAEENDFGDGKSLTLGCFPQMKQLWLKKEDENDTLAEQCFAAKMQTASLTRLCI